MHTLILAPKFSSDTMALWKEVGRQEDWEIHRAQRWAAPDNLVNPVVYGEMQFCDAMASRLGLQLLEPPDDFLGSLDREFTKREVVLMPHRELSQVKTRKFVKPANDKVFVAGIYERGRDVPHRYIDPDCPVLVSDIVEFEVEYRCYILDKAVRTLSCYEWQGMLHQENPDHREDVKAFMAELLQEPSLLLPSACVVDVGLTPQGWAVIEANQAYASGIYHEADPAEILPILARASGKEPLATDHAYLREL